MAKPLGQCMLTLKNPKNANLYHVDFVVVKGNECSSPILGNATIQEMDLVRVQHHNMSLKTVPSQERPTETGQDKPKTSYLTKEEVVKKYLEVFQGTGKLRGQYKFEVEENAEPVIHPPR